MMKRELSIQDVDGNQGVIVNENSGNITLSLNNAVRIPSLISKVVQVLGDLCSEEDGDDLTPDFQQYKPEEKIEYNSVIKYKDIIKKFSAYYYSCNQYLNIYDNSNMRGKTKILRCVHMWYLEAKGEVLLENRGTEETEIDIIRRNSDRIIDMVKERISKVVMNAEKIEEADIEGIELGIACFTCYCFMECKILEKPI